MRYSIGLWHPGPADWRFASAGLALLGALACGCTGDQTLEAPPVAAPDVGWIVVGAAVTGEDIDADGFIVTVDGGSPRRLAVGEAITFSDLRPNTHTVRIDGIAQNCVLHGPDVQAAAVVAHEGTAVIYNVTCIDRSRGGIRVHILTPGFDRFAAAADDGPSITSQGREVLLRDLETGIHAVRLSVNRLACQLDGPNPKFLGVTAGRIIHAYFSLTCPPGSLVVTVTTTGTNRPAAYRAHIVQLDDPYCDLGIGICKSEFVDATGSVWFDRLSLTDYQVTLAVPRNCAVTPGWQKARLTTRGPAHAPFVVNCR